MDKSDRQRLLSLSQMDSHTMKLKKEAVNLTELTRETERLLRPMAEKRNQSLTADVAPDVWTEGDRNKLAQILYNLTDNALMCLQEGSFGIEEPDNVTNWSCIYNPAERTMLFNMRNDLSEVYSIDLKEDL